LWFALATIDQDEVYCEEIFRIRTHFEVLDYSSYNAVLKSRFAKCLNTGDLTYPATAVMSEVQQNCPKNTTFKQTEQT
jgi:hypothetical protein